MDANAQDRDNRRVSFVLEQGHSADASRSDPRPADTSTIISIDVNGDDDEDATATTDSNTTGDEGDRHHVTTHRRRRQRQDSQASAESQHIHVESVIDRLRNAALPFVPTRPGSDASSSGHESLGTHGSSDSSISVRTDRFQGGTGYSSGGSGGSDGNQGGPNDDDSEDSFVQCRYNGVQYVRRDRSFIAVIWCHGRCEVLGPFATELRAALAFDACAESLFGPSFPELNFPSPNDRARLLWALSRASNEEVAALTPEQLDEALLRLAQDQTNETPSPSNADPNTTSITEAMPPPRQRPNRNKIRRTNSY